MSAVCGCIASVALKGIFKVSVNSASSTTSRVGILTVTPAANYLGAADFGAGQLLAVVLCYGLGGFFAGIVLTCRAADGAVALIKMDYPTVASWRWRHQLLITVGICSLAASSAIVQVFDVCVCVWCVVCVSVVCGVCVCVWCVVFPSPNAFVQAEAASVPAYVSGP
jgi:hypothetical protein